MARFDRATVTEMFSDSKRQRAARRVQPGDGHALKPFRWWDMITRTLFHLDLRTADGPAETWSVDTDLLGDWDGADRAHLYRAGKHHATSKLPAAFPVPGGTIEVAIGGFGLKRCHFVPDDGPERQLEPDVASAEGRRAQLDRNYPTIGRIVGIISITVLIAALLIGLPQIVEQVTHVPAVAERVGTFTSPLEFPVWLNVTVMVAALAASIERALRLRYHWLVDGKIFDGVG